MFLYRALENIANTSFDAFTYFNGRNFTENIQQELNDTGFDGVSVSVNFVSSIVKTYFFVGLC